MLTLKKNPKSKVSWVPFYGVLSLILAYVGLNYFSETFCNTFWKKGIMYGMILFEVYTVALCFRRMLTSEIYDLEDKVSCIIIYFALFNIGLKFVTMVYHSAALKKLNNDIMTVTSRYDLEPWELELAQRYYIFGRFILVKMVLMYTITGFFFILMPLLSEKDYTMPVLVEYPGTDISTRAGFLFNFLLGSYCVTYTVAIEMGFDIPVFMQSCFIAFQFERCIHYCSLIGDFDSAYNTQDKQSKLLKYCIELHTSIFRFFDEVAYVNTSVVALTVTTTVPLLTFLLYSVMLSTMSGAPALMVTDAYHLFLYCYLGESVSNKCEETSRAIYTSQWYRIERLDERRMFLFFLTVSQRDMHFSAGGLYTLSLETFTELMKRVYGACAFLSEVL